MDLKIPFVHATHFATVWPDETRLSGTIPDSLGLTALMFMNLGATTLSGTIPDSFSLLTALTDLELGEYMPDRYLWTSKYHPCI